MSKNVSSGAVVIGDLRTSTGSPQEDRKPVNMTDKFVN